MNTTDTITEEAKNKLTEKIRQYARDSLSAMMVEDDAWGYADKIRRTWCEELLMSARTHPSVPAYICNAEDLWEDMEELMSKAIQSDMILQYPEWAKGKKHIKYIARKITETARDALKAYSSISRVPAWMLTNKKLWQETFKAIQDEIVYIIYDYECNKETNTKHCVNCGRFFNPVEQGDGSDTRCTRCIDMENCDDELYRQSLIREREAEIARILTKGKNCLECGCTLLWCRQHKAWHHEDSYKEECLEFEQTHSNKHTKGGK